MVAGLPAGLFEVAVDATTLPPGVVNTFDPDGGNDAISQLTLVAGVNDANQDFGFLGTASIGRVIFRDDNANGLPDAGEGLPGVTVSALWAGPDNTFGNADDRTYSAITDADGAYLIANLPAGQFRVTVDTATLPAGAINNVDPDGGNDSTSALTLTAGQTDLNQNFGYAVPVTVTEPPVATSTGFLPFTGASMVGQLAMLGTILASSGSDS